MSTRFFQVRGGLVAVMLAALAAPACTSSGGNDGAAGPGTGSPKAAGPAKVSDLPPASPAGSGAIVVGGTTVQFAVSECRLEPNPADPEGARALIVVKGAGITTSGRPFTVDLQRFATGTEIVTYTDTVTYADAARILQAQRVEVSGQVTDLRDPKAATPLIRSRRGGVTASGLASAPGDGTDDGGLIGIALDATC